MSRMKTIKTKALLASLLLAAIAGATFAALALVQNAAAQSGDYDTDDDGLIEIRSLEQLDAIRWGHGRQRRGVPGQPGVLRQGLPQRRDRHGLPKLRVRRLRTGAEISTSPTAPATPPARPTRGGGAATAGCPSEAAAPSSERRSTATTTLSPTCTSSEPGHPTLSESGLFGRTGGTIKRIGLTDVNVSGYQKVGGLAGENRGTITGGYATGRVSGNQYVGGLIGSNFGTATDSYATATVSGMQDVGGLAGSNNGTITASHATGDASGDRNVGGLAGISYGTITRSHATGDVSATDPSGRIAGGLVGWNDGAASESYATGNVSGGRDIGGLAGINSDTLSASYSTGNASGSSNVGGLVGGNTSEGAIVASYATGYASGTDSTGGLVGANIDNATVFASYATGAVTGSQKVGGLLGRNHSLGLITASYWDTQTTGQSSDVGAGLSSRAEGKTTAELQSPTGYTGIYAEWRFDYDDADGDRNIATGKDDIWNFGTSGQYPALKVDFDGDGSATWQEFGSQRGQGATPRPTPRPVTPTPATQADLKLSMLVTDNLGSGIYFYQMVVQNEGPDGATGVTLTAHFPPSVSAALAIPVRGTCTLGATVTCDLGNLRSGAMTVVTVVAGLDDPSSTRPISIADVTASETDPDTSNNRALN